MEKLNLPKEFDFLYYSENLKICRYFIQTPYEKKENYGVSVSGRLFIIPPTKFSSIGEMHTQGELIKKIKRFEPELLELLKEVNFSSKEIFNCFKSTYRKIPKDFDKFRSKSSEF